MFGCRPRLPVNFNFPTFRSTEVPLRGDSAKHVDKYVATVHDWLRATLQEAQTQSMAEAQRQKWYYDQKIGVVDLKPGNLVLVKADAFQGKRKIKDWWEDKPHEVVHQIMTDIPSYEVKDQHGQSTHPTLQLTSPHCIRNWHSLVCGCPSSKGQMYQPHPSLAYSQGEWKQDYVIRG